MERLQQDSSHRLSLSCIFTRVLVLGVEVFLLVDKHPPPGLKDPIEGCRVPVDGTGYPGFHSHVTPEVSVVNRALRQGCGRRTRGSSFLSVSTSKMVPGRLYPMVYVYFSDTLHT